jgi:SAM-dependent methyltransferase
MSNSTTRFSDRVEDYVKYRPHYPEAVLGYLSSVYSFDPSWDVADIGSGTGISTELFLRNGNRVYAVEPNAAMRGAAEELLGHYKAAAAGRFVSIDGTAEATGLAAGSIQLIIAGQAFHWFDPVGSKAEFTRILRPGGVATLIWNERLADTPFEREYDELIQHYGKDYKTTNHRNIADLQIADFFHPAAVELAQFANEQRFDFEGLKGRLLSSSYMPKEGPDYSAMLQDLEQLFARRQSAGQVRVGYDTRVYSGVFKT